MNKDLPILFRPVRTTDMAYIIKTWSVDFHKNYPTVHVPNQIYFPNQNKIITNIINACGATICCIDDEPDTIVGFIVAQHLNDQDVMIHWAQTKGIFRKMGILNSLLEIAVGDKNLFCSHHFRLFDTFQTKYKFIYDPTSLEKFQ